MNEQLNNALVDLINKVAAGADALVAFSAEQIPEVLHQLLVWHFTTSLIHFLTGLVLMLVVPVGGGVLMHKKRNSWWVVDGFPLLIVFLFTSFSIGFLMTYSNLTWIKVWLAPKLFLLEYGASLIK